MHELITILGPTATGKTRLAASVAAAFGGEVISADSRQVYRGMDLGTGKDLDEYVVDGLRVPYHLVDIADPGEEYNVYRFQQDFLQAFKDICARQRRPVMCGGTGMYLESVILAYGLKDGSHDETLRQELESMSDEQLSDRLRSLRELHNVTDIRDRDRMIRAIEVSLSSGEEGNTLSGHLSDIKHRVFGISLPREEIRKRITTRLRQRLEEGMVEEVKMLLDKGLSPAQLEFYGLEYRYLTRYVTGEISYNDMFQKLNSAIHQFAKRQATWFRRMERKGVNIQWIDGSMDADAKAETIMKSISAEKL
jgi:tRNA dimethylallyltransferase